MKNFGLAKGVWEALSILTNRYNMYHALGSKGGRQKKKDCFVLYYKYCSFYMVW
jgi:hypothetical protein